MYWFTVKYWNSIGHILTQTYDSCYQIISLGRKGTVDLDNAFIHVFQRIYPGQLGISFPVPSL